MKLNLGNARNTAEMLVFILVVAGAGFRVGWQRLRARRTRKWPKTSATIRSWQMQSMKLDDKTDIVLPCFTFRYDANGESFSGKFSLFTDGEEEGKSVAGRMIGRSLDVRFDPKRPSTWIIPDKRIEGYEVEQKMSPHLFEKLYPSD
jgi:hypothetical protein